MTQPLPAYSQEINSVLSSLATSEAGLTETEAQKRLAQNGSNKITTKSQVSWWKIFLAQFKNSLILILIGAAILIFFVYVFGGQDPSDLVEGGLILGIILLITFLGFYQEFKAEKAIEALKKLLAFKAKVIRNGVTKEIAVEDLVTGDIVILEEGEKVPADLRLLEVFNLSTLEASLTGESTPVHKIKTALAGNLQIADQRNMVFSSTVIAQGRGQGVVVATGDLTEIGKIATSMAEIKEEPTPIQKRLDQIGRLLGFGVLVIASIVFIFIVFFATESYQLPLFERILKAFIAAIALAVAAIPEGLPAVVTIALALGTKRMLKRNVLVRKLNSIETLGSTDVICSDKTGTLTKGEMTVTSIYFDDKLISISGTGYEKNGVFTEQDQPYDAARLALLLECGYQCNNAQLDDNRPLGDPTEIALLISSAKSQLTFSGKRVEEIPFSSERKMMTVAVEKGGEKLVFSKGAPEILLGHCNRIIKNGQVTLLTLQDKEKLLKVTQDLSSLALRTLAFAYKKEDQKGLEEDLIFIGLQGMYDPPREEVKPLITQCKSSGIRVIMITGDHPSTARAVASQIGLVGGSLSGAEIESFSQEDFEAKVKEVNVYARVTPSIKLKIVTALKKQGHIVAMTGDGVNDAPALKKADIGIAMGIAGTDVAKEASDMVLLDDQFGTIVAAIEEGRGIFDNIRKFVNYLLSSNIGEILVVFLALVFFQHLPLTAIMLLWINIITDGLPAIALGMDPAEKGIMKHPPSRFQEQIVTKRLWVEMVIFGLLLAGAVLVIYALNLPEGLEEARAAAFVALVVFELVRLLIIRLDYHTPLLANKKLLLAVAVSLLLQIAIVYTPFLAALFEIKHFAWHNWLLIILSSGLLWLGFTFLRSFLPLRRTTN